MFIFFMELYVFSVCVLCGVSVYLCVNFGDRQTKQRFTEFKIKNDNTKTWLFLLCEVEF